MSELTKRVLFAIPAAAFALWVTWSGGLLFYGCLIVLVLLIQSEVKEISDKAGFRPSRFFPYIIGLWILLAPVLPYAFEFGIALFLLFAAVQVMNTKKDHMQQFIATIFSSGYASFGLLFLLMIRNSGPDEVGFILTITFFVMVWGNDVFAYFGGKMLGRHLLAPTMSPNKTWEGFYCGFLGSAAGLAVIWLLVPYELTFNWVYLIPSILAVGVFAPLGDLAESKLKRAANMKDASTILPGHGGLFDRFDGVILAAPAFYLYIQFLEIIGYVSF